ncbi:MAG: hypothetical protein QM820_09250 [Minicystis sp.]
MRARSSRDTPPWRLLLGIFGPPGVALWIGLSRHADAPATRQREWLCIVSGLMVLTAGLARFTWRGHVFGRRPELDLPRDATRIAEAVGGARVLVAGRVARGEATVRSPISGKSGVLVAIEVNAWRSLGPKTGLPIWHREHAEVLHVPFLLDDGSGTSLLVRTPPTVDVERSDRTIVHASDAGIDAFPRNVRTYLARQKGLAGELAQADRVRVYETVIADGAEITVLGCIARAGASVYRGGDSEPLRLEDVDIVFAGSPAELRAWNRDHARYRALLTTLLVVAMSLFAAALWLAVGRSR